MEGGQDWPPSRAKLTHYRIFDGPRFGESSRVRSESGSCKPVRRDDKAITTVRRKSDGKVPPCNQSGNPFQVILVGGIEIVRLIAVDIQHQAGGSVIDQRHHDLRTG